jgi:hypothetical protein
MEESNMVARLQLKAVRSRIHDSSYFVRIIEVPQVLFSSEVAFT